MINPLDRPVQAAVQLPVDYWEDPAVAGGVRVVGPTGTTLPSQVEPAPRGRVIVTRVDLPPGGECTLRVEPAASASPPASRTDGFANSFYRIAWDDRRGLHSWIDAGTGRCDGCQRTLDEIADWGTMPDAERLAVWGRIVRRREAAGL